MKKAVFFRLWLPTLAVLTLTLSSCDNDNDHWQTNTTTALVTVRPTQEGSFNMQLDNNTTLVASNLTSSPYGDKEVRAIINYTDEGENRGDIRSVRINWMDSIRTKLPVPERPTLRKRPCGDCTRLGDSGRGWISHPANPHTVGRPKRETLCESAHGQERR